MMQWPTRRATTSVMVLAGLGLAPATNGEVTTFTWDIAQSLDPCTEPCLYHLTLIGPDQPGQYVVNARVNVRFTTNGDFDASEFYLDLWGPIVQPDDDIGAAWNATGQDFGWSGQGTFFADVSTDVLDGEVYLPDGAPASFWSLHVGDFGHAFMGNVRMLEYELTLSDEPPVEPTPGDLDGDGTVGVLDFLALLSAWGPCPAPPAECPADLDGDGEVGTIDLLELLANWGA